MKWFLGAVIVIGLLVGLTALALTEPRQLEASVLPDNRRGDVENGRYLFWAGGCASCHAFPCPDAPNRSCARSDEEKVRLTGGVTIDTPFGKFVAPNISTDAEAGIGGWTTLDFVNAMKRGVSPDHGGGRHHYYPVFPYASYQRMTIADLVDLKAYLDTLPAVADRPPAHELKFPFSIRRGIGMWKLLALDGEDFTPDPAQSDEVNRGAYLVSGPGHCSECHTPRGLFGIDTALAPLDHSRWLGGAPNPEGDGMVPNITPDEATGIGRWSETDIAYALESGFTPEFDTLGGAMAKVQENMAKLNPEDRLAIAAYLKSIPAIDLPKR